jgi:tripartite-type tricarboxylate transporter receptor subunit TctC
VKKFSLIALLLFPLAAVAQQYPAKPIRIVVPYPPGGSGTIVARILGDRLNHAWGQQILVDSRPGASGMIGAEIVAKAAPDGYTLLLNSITTHGIGPHLYTSLPYDSVKDFTPITLVAKLPLVMTINAGHPMKSVKEVIDYAKANPGKLNYASVGIGTSAHLATVLFMNVVDVKMQHIPYSQMSQSYSDIFSGRTEIWFTTAGGSLPHVKSGKVRALAVNGPTRSKLLPELPTMIELGINMKDESSWYGFFAPKGTPKAIVDKINRDLQTVLDMPDMRERELALGYRFMGGPPDKLAQYLQHETDKWSELAKKGAFK